MIGLPRRPWLPLVVSAVLLAAAPQDEGDRPLALSADPDFGDATAALREFLHDRRILPSKAQNFCVVGYQGAAGKRAWVYWRDGQEIILWSGSTQPRSVVTAIARSRRVIHLGKDVVPTEADLQGSSYFVTRAWVDRLLADCRARGDRYKLTNPTK